MSTRMGKCFMIGLINLTCLTQPENDIGASDSRESISHQMGGISFNVGIAGRTVLRLDISLADE